MPILIATGFTEKGKPILWTCSACREAFSLEWITGEPSVSELHKINDNFRLHCDKTHPGDKALGIQIPKSKEDASQTAARIVREATED